MAAFMDDDAWADWKSDLDACVHGLQKVKDDLERRAAKEGKRGAKVRKTIGQAFILTDSGAPIFIKATDAVRPKYVELDGALKIMRPYYPLSLTPFEPVVQSERYEYIRTLQLSMPTVMLKAPVGGAIGTLHWIMWRETDDDASDASEIEDARKLIQPLIPTIHDRAVKRECSSRG